MAASSPPPTPPKPAKPPKPPKPGYRLPEAYLRYTVVIALIVGATVTALAATAAGHADYAVAAGLGALSGSSDLVSRFRENPGRAVTTTPGILYLLLNALASVAALYAIHVFGWTFGASGAGVPVTQVLVAGLAALALFKTSLTVRLGDQPQSIGLDRVTQSFLDSANRAVDRQLAGERAQSVTEAMTGVDFEKAWISLPSFTIALMQNVSAADQKDLGDAVGKLGAGQEPNVVKSMLLGLTLMNVVGVQALKSAVKALGSEIR